MHISNRVDASMIWQAINAQAEGTKSEMAAEDLLQAPCTCEKSVVARFECDKDASTCNKLAPNDHFYREHARLSNQTNELDTPQPMCNDHGAGLSCLEGLGQLTGKSDSLELAFAGGKQVLE